MNAQTEKVLLVESNDALRQQLTGLLSESGYEVSTDYTGGMKAVLSFAPDAVVLGADPPKLDCCDLLSEIKGSERTQHIRVLMVAPGGAAERARGLDLGADDVLSVPFDAHELLSRLRVQLRDKHASDEIAEQLENVQRSRQDTDRVVSALNEERRTLKASTVAIIAILFAGGLVGLFVHRRTQQQNTRVFAAITRLQSGLASQQQLLENVRRARDEMARAPVPASDPQKAQLQQKSAELKAKIAAGNAENAPALQKQLNEIQGRIQKLETGGRFAQDIIESYEPSVCLIHVVLAFRDHNGGLTLHYAGLTPAGDPLTDERNSPVLSLTGSGPEVHLDVFGTGFLVSTNGQVLTNHHVVEPWWGSDELKEMFSQGLDPKVVEMTAYFPGVPRGIALTTEKISSAADVALVKGDVSQLRLKQLPLADGKRDAVSGGPVVLLGYPTALGAILARAGEETVQAVATASKGNPRQVMEELARRRLIRPTTTQGHIGDVLADKIVYDAQTTSGGSGGPLFNGGGKVIGINFAMLPEFGGSNLAVPIGFGKTLLKP
jgi:DNA-binding response OmpR family regulator/S1-C subfamily serine protease